MAASDSKLHADDIIIAIMGPTGVGKSNFIDVLLDQPGARASHGLSSCTNDVQTTSLNCSGRRIILAELPASDNTTQSTAKVRERIKEWSKVMGQQKVQLAGILYLHSIAKAELTLGPKDPQIIRGLCGKATQVKLVTTMWDETEQQVGVEREASFAMKFKVYLSPLEDPDHWARREGFDQTKALRIGSRGARFLNTTDSAINVVEAFVMKTIQRETLILLRQFKKLEPSFHSTHASLVFYRNMQEILRNRKEAILAIANEVNGPANSLRLAELRQGHEEIEWRLQEMLDEVRRYKLPRRRRISSFFIKNPNFIPKELEARLYDLTAEISGNSKSREAFCDTFSSAEAKDDAQIMADYLNIVLHGMNVFGESDGRKILHLLCGLAKSAEVYPRYYRLKGIHKDPDPFQGGGFADVYKGKHKDREICLKVIRLFDDEDRARFLRIYLKEIVLWGRLSHENILPFYGVYILDGKGISNKIPKLLGCLWEVHPLPSLKRVNVVVPTSQTQDIIEGLSYLHNLEIAHGDLKAVNVLVSDTGRALITDFGLSFVAMSSVVVSSGLSVGGTTNWTAPELISGTNEPVKPTEKSDIWSFGCLCYEIFTGMYPFYQCRNSAQVTLALQRGEIPIRPTPGDIILCDQLDDWMWNIMLGCWKGDPGARSTCGVIRDCLKVKPMQDPRPRSTSERLGGNLAFWEAMRAQSDIAVDYSRVESLLLEFHKHFFEGVLTGYMPEGLGF